MRSCFERKSLIHRRASRAPFPRGRMKTNILNGYRTSCMNSEFALETLCDENGILSRGAFSYEVSPEISAKLNREVICHRAVGCHDRLHQLRYDVMMHRIRREPSNHADSNHHQMSELLCFVGCSRISRGQKAAVSDVPNGHCSARIANSR
jgi:hypothetical protein